MKPKCKSKEQYEILLWIDKMFEDENIKIELIGRVTVKIIDNNGESITLSINKNSEIFNQETKEVYGKA